MSWYALRLEPEGSRDDVLAVLFENGAAGVHEDGQAVVAHFDSESAATHATAAIAAVAPGLKCSLEATPVVDWANAWRTMKAFDAGGLTIAPPWLSEAGDPARTIVIEPGMAFGTGDHPSTRGALRILAQSVKEGDVVADLGTGTAVLAIAAARFGASRAYAIEIDPDALANARENIERNGVAACVHLLEGDAALLLPLLAPVHVVVANIVSSVHVSLLTTISAALHPGGCAILAGVLTEERIAFRRILESEGWRVDIEDVEEEWWCGRMRRA